MNIYEQLQGTKLTLSLEGQLTSITAVDLENRLGQILEADTVTTIVFEFSGLSFVSSAGIRVILRTMKLMNAKRGKVSITNISDAVRETFEISGLIDLFVHDEKLVIIEKERTAEAKVVLSLDGTLDAKTVLILNNKLKMLEEQGASVIFLDCAGIDSIAPEGRQMLEEAVKRLRAKQKRLIITNLTIK
jgi:anti-sigma B factor antagonist